MNKTEFIDFITKQGDVTKPEATKALNLVLDGIISAISEGNEVAFIGFGTFTNNPVNARSGTNPKTREPLEIAAYNQIRFRVGQRLKDAANNSISNKKNSDKKKASTRKK